jgi:predicted small metal-binding protein
MKNFRCGDVVPGCTRAFTGTEEDILTQVALHARADHGLVDISAELVTQVQSAMTLVAA